MKPFVMLFISATAMIVSSSFKSMDCIEEEISSNIETYPSFGQNQCSSSFGGSVTTHDLTENGSKVGHAIWISRKSQRVKAKYFAHKQFGYSVYDRYKEWRADKKVVLMSSGAYTGSNDVPVGLTVDNGNIVNKDYDDKMDGLVVVYATGGIVVSNVEDGDLYLDALGKKIDIRDAYSRNEFLNWAVGQKATVFQTHLLAYKNKHRFYKDTQEKACRKFLVLATSSSGELFHIIFYPKYKNYSLYDGTNRILNYLIGQSMQVTAILNLDTGMYDIVGTGEGTKDCKGNFITGTTNNREEMTNLLAYEFN